MKKKVQRLMLLLHRVNVHCEHGLGGGPHLFPCRQNEVAGIFK